MPPYLKAMPDGGVADSIGFEPPETGEDHPIWTVAETYAGPLI